MKKENLCISHFCTHAHQSVFARAHNAGRDFSHPLLHIARERATNFPEEVSFCGELLSFARTYFENES